MFVCKCELRSADFVASIFPVSRRDRLLASWRNCCKVNRKLAASVVCKRGQSCCCNVSNVSSVSNLPLQLLKPCGGKCQVHFAVRKSLSRSRSMSLLAAHSTWHLPLATLHTATPFWLWQFINQIAFHWRGQKATLATRSGNSSLAA